MSTMIGAPTVCPHCHLTIWLYAQPENIDNVRIRGYNGTYLDINEASSRAFQLLAGYVGKQKADAIVSYRDQHGPFSSVDDLTNVPGIGHEILRYNQDLFIVGERP